MYDQVNYMVMYKPLSSRVYTPVSDGSIAGLAMANFFGSKEKADHVASECNLRENGNIYTVFKLTHCGFTASCGGGRID